MPVTNRNRTIVTTLHWSRTDSQAAPYTRVSNATYSAGYWKNWNRVDPARKLFHGNYQFEFSDFTTLPTVDAKLMYESTNLTIKRYWSNTCVGTVRGFAIPRCRYLYENEKSYFSLINNCIKGAQEEQVNVALFIGELHQSADLISSAATKIATAAGQVRKGQFSRAARTLNIRKPTRAKRNKTFANNWLEFTYGWSPLVFDAIGAMKHIHRGARTLLINARSRTSSSVPLFSQGAVEIEKQAADQHLLNYTYKWNSTWERNEQVHLVFRPTSAFWDQVSRLGFMDPGILAWESIPLSFVVDWFVNIGDVLGSLNLGLTLEYVTGSYVEFHRNSGTLAGSGNWASLKSDYKYTVKKAIFSSPVFTDLKLKRTIVPEAHVEVTFALSVGLAVNRAITSTALVVQRLK